MNSDYLLVGVIYQSLSSDAVGSMPVIEGRYLFPSTILDDNWRFQLSWFDDQFSEMCMNSNLKHY